MLEILRSRILPRRSGYGQASRKHVARTFLKERHIQKLDFNLWSEGIRESSRTTYGEGKPGRPSGQALEGVQGDYTAAIEFPVYRDAVLGFR